MKLWWNRLAERERRILTLSAGLLALGLGYVALIEPLLEASLAARTRRDAQAAAALRLQAAARAAAGLRAKQLELGVLPDGVSMQSALEDSASASGLRERLTALRPTGADVYEAQLQDASLAATLQWLLQLQRQYGIRVQTVDIRPAGAPGTATFALTLAATRD